MQEVDSYSNRFATQITECHRSLQDAFAATYSTAACHK